MAEILKEWLTERLQRQIVWNAEDFGDLMKDGEVIAGVLLSYKVIDADKYCQIRASNAADDIRGNWAHLKEWLHELDIHLTDTEIKNASEGEGTTLLRLFYQLFLHLDKMDRIDFIKRERKMVSSLVKKMDNRFKVDKIKEKPEPAVDYLSKPLLDEKHFIAWQKKKSEEVKETFDYIRHKYVKTLRNINEKNTPCYHEPLQTVKTSKNKKDMELFAQKFPCEIKNYTYDELVEMETKAVESRKNIIDSAWAQNYMDNLLTRVNSKADSKEFQKQMTNSLSSSMWNMSVEEAETKLDIDLAQNVLKLSQFEKQMCTQIMETKQQARNMFQNRVQAEKEFSEQRKEQFEQYLDNIKENLKSQTDEADFEKARQDMLHRKLYAEKMKRKRQHYYEICYDTMLSIVDYAAKYAESKKIFGEDIPEHYIHEWKMLYFRHQPIFEFLESTEKLLEEPEFEEEVLPEVEEIIRLELDRQESLNDGEFLEYHNYVGPWCLNHLISNYELESEESKVEYLGNQILGHVVFTLLEIKYPYPPPRMPADLSHLTSKAVVRNLPEKAHAVAMQTLLNLKNIHVVRLETAINYCLREFKSEMVGCTDIILSFDAFLAAAKEESDKDLIRSMKAEEEGLSKNTESLSPILSPNAKQTQTPKTIPEEDIALSRAADLGKYAYQALSNGDELTSYLLVDMIVEYIKAQEEIKGFVIINYPNTYQEAQILEEAFSGRAPPDEEGLEDKDDIYLEEAIANHRKDDKDEFKEIRISKLVNNPHKGNIETPFESFFTCYIRLIETEDILQEEVIWELTPDNSELIDRFYSVMGVNYSMYYEVIEKDLVAEMGKYIIGDCLVPVMSYDRLFGENVLSNLDLPSSPDKRSKSKTLRPEVSQNIIGKSKEKLGKKSKQSFSTQSDQDGVKVPSSVQLEAEDVIVMYEETVEKNASKATLESLEDVKVLAGEDAWVYSTYPFDQSLGVALATFWEEVEKVYLHDMKQMFFAIRLQMNSLALYMKFIKDKMEQIINLPSMKQDLVCHFQKEYNEFEDDWRATGITKNEWHCRVKELKNKLYNICDERKLFEEQKRRALIMDNWAMEELTSMVNSYISCMQAELNRSILTFQVLQDFYLIQLKRLPQSDRLSSKDLTKIVRESDDFPGSKKTGEDKLYRQLKTSYLDLQLKNIEIDYSNNPFNLIIEINAKNALKIVKDTNDSHRSHISKENAELSKTSVSKKKEDKGEDAPSVTSEELFLANAQKCIEEWSTGVTGEMYRACQRITALQNKCNQDMKLFNDCIFKTFTLVQNEIDTCYMNEIESVDRLCKYLQLAIETNQKIAETLILDHDKFIIDPNLLQFSSVKPPPEQKIDDIVNPDDFTIIQLDRLRSQLKAVAPTGIALQQTFIYMLQDFVIFGQETRNGSMLPEVWKRLDPEQVPKLVLILFGETAYVDWRDFLIYCANIRFPYVEELIELRHDLRCIDENSTELVGRKDFLKLELWFERDFDPEDPCSQLRKDRIKELFFNLFETSKDMMNYSAFLLAICKSTDPLEGFASALSVAIGRKICFLYENCIDVVCNLIKHKQYRDACRACAMECTAKFLDTIIHKVIDECVGTTIVDVKYEPVVEDKKTKKGKGTVTSKLKRGEQASQSARAIKEKKSVTDIKSITHSAVEVQTTYICPPCTEEEAPEEAAPQEAVVEETPESPKEDPTLVYAVSQDVIWKVLRICMPWHFVLVPEDTATPYKAQVEEVLRLLQADTDEGDIYVARLLKEPNMCKILHKVKKFTAQDVFYEMRTLL